MKNLHFLLMRHLTSSPIPVLLIFRYKKTLFSQSRTKMILLLSVSLLLFQPLSSNAQAPQQFSFQGVARDASGKIITNSSIAYSFSIHQGSANGTVVYQNEGATTTNSAGVFNVTVGTTNSPLPSTIQWGSDKFFLQVGIDPDGAGGGGFFFTDLGTTQLISVPYAMYSSESAKWKNNSPIVQKGDLGIQTPLPTVGPGPTLIWHPSKYAFRAGYPANNDWEDNSIGGASFASGQFTRATAPYTFASGYSSYALAENAIAMGHTAIATSKGSIALGETTTASGENTLSLGKNTVASGGNSIAIGLNSTASGIGAVSIGNNIGTAASYCTTLGFYNNNGDVPNGSNTDRLFQIGNGTIGNRSNALTVLKNGFVGIGKNTATPEYILDVDGRMRLRHNGNTSGMWLNNAANNPSIFVGNYSDNAFGFFFQQTGAWKFNVNSNGDGHLDGHLYVVELHELSDKRLKTNISKLSGSLKSLTSLSGYRYKLKQGGEGEQIGVMAQEVEKYFPELVRTKEDGFKAVRYTGLIPHLIEAVKELDKKTGEITALKKELASMQEVNKKLAALEASVKELLAGQARTSTPTAK